MRVLSTKIWNTGSADISALLGSRMASSWKPPKGTVLKCSVPAIETFPMSRTRPGGSWQLVVPLSSIEWRIIKHYLPQIAAAVDSAAAGSFQAVDCGTFSRKKTVDE